MTDPKVLDPFSLTCGDTHDLITQLTWTLEHQIDASEITETETAHSILSLLDQIGSTLLPFDKDHLVCKVYEGNAGTFLLNALSMAELLTNNPTLSVEHFKQKLSASTDLVYLYPYLSLFSEEMNNA